MECIVNECVREAHNGYCKKHELAKTNIDKNFEQWQVAYGKKFSMKDYLTRLSEDYEIGAGVWVIEVAEYLLDQD